jgi:hypothetical protein
MSEQKKESNKGQISRLRKVVAPPYRGPGLYRSSDSSLCSFLAAYF